MVITPLRAVWQALKNAFELDTRLHKLRLMLEFHGSPQFDTDMYPYKVTPI